MRLTQHRSALKGEVALMKRIIFLLKVVALAVVLLAMSVLPASGINTTDTNTAQFCNTSSLTPAVEAERHPGTP
jgi:hypothetical protein